MSYSKLPAHSWPRLLKLSNKKASSSRKNVSETTFRPVPAQTIHHHLFKLDVTQAVTTAGETFTSTPSAPITDMSHPYVMEKLRMRRMNGTRMDLKTRTWILQQIRCICRVWTRTIAQLERWRMGSCGTRQVQKRCKIARRSRVKGQPFLNHYNQGPFVNSSSSRCSVLNNYNRFSSRSS